MGSPRELIFDSGGIAIWASDQVLHLKCRHWDDETFDAHVQATRAFLSAQEEIFVALIDLDGAQNPNGRERQLLVQLWNDFAVPMDGKLIAMAYVVTSKWIGGVLQLFSWLKGPAAPSRSFSTKAEAACWLEVNLDAHLAFDAAG